MARTMAANLTGARLREVDQALRDARGAPAVDALMKAHPHEAKVLQHLFDERRAGRPVPALLRIARVMIWSDGAMEFRLVDMPPPMGSAAAPHGGAFGSPSGRPGLGQRDPSRSLVSGRPPSAGPVPGGSGPAGPVRTGRPAWGDRGQGVGPSGGAPAGTSAPRLRTAWVGGTRLDPAPRQVRRRPGEDDDVGWGDAPRAGDGWSVVRPGEVLPMDPGDPPDYEAHAQTTAEDPGAVDGGSVAPAHLPSLEGGGADDGDQSSVDHVHAAREPLAAEMSEAAVSVPEASVPGEATSDPAVHASPPRDAAEDDVDPEGGRHETPAMAAFLATENGPDPLDAGTIGHVAIDAEPEPEMSLGGPIIESATGSELAADQTGADGEEVGRGADVSVAIAADAPDGEGADSATQSPSQLGQ